MSSPAASDLRPLSAAQLPIWRSEMLYRNTPRWTQMTVIRLSGTVDADRLEQAIDAVVMRHPALRTEIVLHRRQGWQVVRAASDFSLVRHLEPVAPPDRAAAIASFIEAAARYRFPLHGGNLFRADLLVPGTDSAVLVLRLHHIAADGVALAIMVTQIAAWYRGERWPPGPDPAYERWLDRQQDPASLPGLQPALDFYRQALAGATLHHDALYGGAGDATSRSVPDLLEATRILSDQVCDGLRRLARVNGVTLFIVLFAAYAAVLARATGSSDLVIATFVSGRAGEGEPLVGSCINTVLVRIRMDGSDAPDAIRAVQAGWRPVRRHQGVPIGVLSEMGGMPPLAQAAINYLDMSQAEFSVPGVTAEVTHAQQGYPLNDLLLYALREQDGRLRLRLIGGSGTSRFSQERVTFLLRDLAETLESWLA